MNDDVREIAEKYRNGAQPCMVRSEVEALAAHVLRCPEPLGEEAFRFTYTVTFSVDEDGDIVARIPALKGCVAHGRGVAEALRRLKEVHDLWIADCVESGDVVPVEEDTK